jgi:C1A family cysteine protease
LTADDCSETPSAPELDHGVLAIGYGTDPDAGEYILVKNSWGATWGAGGYVKISFEDNACGILLAASYPIV